MLVNKQVKDEYTTLVMPRLTLFVRWMIQTHHRPFHDTTSQQILPKEISSQLRFLDIGLLTNSMYSGKLLLL